MAMIRPRDPQPVVPPQPQAAPAPATQTPADQAQFDSRELMRGAREVLIRHAGQVYRLRHTRNDKLILVK
ncbi:hemin uptake protein HemP [Arenimonas sp. MALMAid1274]|uniref:hemin uptake protein HemP n=1 Tax=Arenimonas sp. MALMAid1274 TaxID=3411630 RepID=UPI003B9DFBD6